MTHTANLIRRGHKRFRKLIWKPLNFGIAVFLLFGAIGAGVMFTDLSATHDRPREQVTVVSVRETGETARCSKYRRGPINLITFRSDNPPSGYPEVFEHTERCSHRHAGDRFEIVRTGTPGGEVTVWFNHPDGFWDALWKTLLIAVPAGAAGALLLRVLQYYDARLGRKARSRHGAGSETSPPE